MFLQSFLEGEFFLVAVSCCCADRDGLKCLGLSCVLFFRAPICNIPGRSYDVQILHLSESFAEDRVDAAVKQIINIHVKEEPGDVLVFMPGTLGDMLVSWNGRLGKGKEKLMRLGLVCRSG